RFLSAFEEYARHADAGVELTLPVPIDPTTGDESSSTERNRITHPSSRLWAELCDVRYQMLVGELWLAILLPSSTAPGNMRTQLLRKAVVTEMKKGIAMIARKLATLPRGADAASRVRSAGAPLRMPPYAELPADVPGWKQF